MRSFTPRRPLRKTTSEPPDEVVRALRIVVDGDSNGSTDQDDAFQGITAHREDGPQAIYVHHGPHQESESRVSLPRHLKRTRKPLSIGQLRDVSAWQEPVQYVDPDTLTDLAVPVLPDTLEIEQFSRKYRGKSINKPVQWEEKIISEPEPVIPQEAQEEVIVAAPLAEIQSLPDTPDAVITVSDVASTPAPAIEVMERFVQNEAEGFREIEQVVQATTSVPSFRVLIKAFLVLALVVTVPAGAASLSRSYWSSADTIQTDVGAALALAKRAAHEPIRDASSLWRQSAKSFEQVQTSFTELNLLTLGLAKAIPQTKGKVKTAEAALELGRESSLAADLFAQGIARAQESDVKTPDERIIRFLTYLEQATPHLERAEAALKRINPKEVPEGQRESFEGIQRWFLQNQSVMSQFEELAKALLLMVGHEQPRTYLVMFQNPTELRPSGGFFGSYAELTLDRGQIKSLRVPGGGPYDLRGQLTFRRRAPEGMRLLRGEWEFQDVNWFPDFAQTAKKVQEFWRGAGQPTLDGVIAMNASILPKLLEKTGPIELPAYNKTISAENFFIETQKAVEIEYDREENKPKAIIGDLAKAILEKMSAMPQSEWLGYAALLAEGMEEKEVQMHFFHQSEQALARTFGWTGEWPASRDNLYALIGANVAGQKTDLRVNERVNLAIRLQSDGRETGQVTWSREHTGVPKEVFYGVKNIQYARWYFTPGTRVTEARGFEAPSSSLFQIPLEQDLPDPDLAVSTKDTSGLDRAEENGLVVYGGWVQLEPKTSQEIALSYERRAGFEVLPSGETMYRLSLVSQSGKARPTTIRVAIPDGATVKETNGQIQNSEVAFSWNGKRDEVLHITFANYAR